MEHDTNIHRTAPNGVFDSVKQLVRSIVVHLQTRMALLSTEFAEEKQRLMTLLYSALMALFFIFVTLILALLFVIAAYWNTPYRLHAIGALTVLFFAGAVIAWLKARAQIYAKPRLFAASLSELYKDRQQLDTP